LALGLVALILGDDAEPYARLSGLLGR